MTTINDQMFPLVYALRETMKKFENSENTNDKFIYDMLRRSEAIWNSIKINGLEFYGMSYQQFCDQCQEKNNIIFMSDAELEKFNKAVKIMNILDD